jgi:Domain of unknown function (DUF1905)
VGSGDATVTDLAAIAAEFGDDPGIASRDRDFAHTGQVWRWTSAKGDTTAAWFFLTITGDAADSIRAIAGPRRGFGSVRVKARIGDTDFATSLFPQKEVDGFILPLKAQVRRAEGLEEGDEVTVLLTL